MHWDRLALVGLGGFVGAVGRYAVRGWIQQRAASSFPVGTLAVNVLGCLALGLLVGAAARGGVGQRWMLFGGVGLLGGFTTFSTFGVDTVELIRDGHATAALGSVAANVLLGTAAAAAGIWQAAGVSAGG